MNSKNLSKAINRMLAILLTAAMVAGSFTVPVKAEELSEPVVAESVNGAEEAADTSAEAEETSEELEEAVKAPADEPEISEEGDEPAGNDMAVKDNYPYEVQIEVPAFVKVPTAKYAWSTDRKLETNLLKEIKITSVNGGTEYAGKQLNTATNPIMEQDTYNAGAAQNDKDYSITVYNTDGMTVVSDRSDTTDLGVAGDYKVVIDIHDRLGRWCDSATYEWTVEKYTLTEIADLLTVTWTDDNSTVGPTYNGVAANTAPVAIASTDVGSVSITGTDAEIDAKIKAAFPGIEKTQNTPNDAVAAVKADLKTKVANGFLAVNSTLIKATADDGSADSPYGTSGNSLIDVTLGTEANLLPSITIEGGTYSASTSVLISSFIDTTTPITKTFSIREGKIADGTVIVSENNSKALGNKTTGTSGGIKTTTQKATLPVQVAIDKTVLNNEYSIDFANYLEPLNNGHATLEKITVKDAGSYFTKGKDATTGLNATNVTNNTVLNFKIPGTNYAQPESNNKIVLGVKYKNYEEFTLDVVVTEETATSAEEIKFAGLVATTEGGLKIKYKDAGHADAEVKRTGLDPAKDLFELVDGDGNAFTDTASNGYPKYNIQKQLKPGVWGELNAWSAATVCRDIGTYRIQAAYKSDVITTEKIAYSPAFEIVPAELTVLTKTGGSAGTTEFKYNAKWDSTNKVEVPDLFEISTATIKFTSDAGDSNISLTANTDYDIEYVNIDKGAYKVSEVASPVIDTTITDGNVCHLVGGATGKVYVDQPYAKITVKDTVKKYSTKPLYVTFDLKGGEDSLNGVTGIAQTLTYSAKKSDKYEVEIPASIFTTAVSSNTENLDSKYVDLDATTISTSSLTVNSAVSKKPSLSVSENGYMLTFYSTDACVTGSQAVFSITPQFKWPYTKTGSTVSVTVDFKDLLTISLKKNQQTYTGENLKTAISNRFDLTDLDAYVVKAGTTVDAGVSAVEKEFYAEATGTPTKPFVYGGITYEMSSQTGSVQNAGNYLIMVTGITTTTSGVKFEGPVYLPFSIKKYEIKEDDIVLKNTIATKRRSDTVDFAGLEGEIKAISGSSYIQVIPALTSSTRTFDAAGKLTRDNAATTNNSYSLTAVGPTNIDNDTFKYDVTVNIKADSTNYYTASGGVTKTIIVDKTDVAGSTNTSDPYIVAVTTCSIGNNGKVTIDGSTGWYYDGYEKEPVVTKLGITVTNNNVARTEVVKTLAKSKISYENNIDAGSADIIFDFDGDMYYKGQIKKTNAFTIVARTNGIEKKTMEIEIPASTGNTVVQLPFEYDVTSNVGIESSVKKAVADSYGTTAPTITVPAGGTLAATDTITADGKLTINVGTAGTAGDVSNAFTLDPKFTNFAAAAGDDKLEITLKVVDKEVIDIKAKDSATITKVYDGKAAAYPDVVLVSHGGNATDGTAPGEGKYSDISVTKAWINATTGKELTEAPVNAGTYTCRVSLVKNNKYIADDTFLTYTITKAVATVEPLTDHFIYNGESQADAIVTGVDGKRLVKGDDYEIIVYPNTYGAITSVATIGSTGSITTYKNADRYAVMVQGAGATNVNYTIDEASTAAGTDAGVVVDSYIDEKALTITPKTGLVQYKDEGAKKEWGLDDIADVSGLVDGESLEYTANGEAKFKPTGGGIAFGEPGTKKEETLAITDVRGASGTDLLNYNVTFANEGKVSIEFLRREVTVDIKLLDGEANEITGPVLYTGKDLDVNYEVSVASPVLATPITLTEVTDYEVTVPTGINEPGDYEIKLIGVPTSNYDVKDKTVTLTVAAPEPVEVDAVVKVGTAAIKNDGTSKIGQPTAASAVTAVLTDKLGVAKITDDDYTITVVKKGTTTPLENVQDLGTYTVTIESTMKNYSFDPIVVEFEIIETVIVVKSIGDIAAMPATLEAGEAATVTYKVTGTENGEEADITDKVTVNVASEKGAASSFSYPATASASPIAITARADAEPGSKETFTISYVEGEETVKGTFVLRIKTDNPTPTPGSDEEYTKEEEDKRVSIENATVTGIKSYTYTGDAVEPAPTVKLGNKKLTLGKDYRIFFDEAPVAAGTYVIHIAGINDYKDEVVTSGGGDYTFEIKPVDIKGSGVKVTAGTIAKNDDGDLDYDTLSYAVYYKTLTLEDDVDFIIDSETAPSTDRSGKNLTFRINGQGNYQGSKDIKVKIVEKGKKTGVIKNGDAAFTVEAEAATYVFDGKTKHQPAVEVTVDGTTLTLNKDYKVSYKNNVNAGIAQAVVTGKGNYVGTAVLTFGIEQASAVMDDGGWATIKNNTPKFNGKLQKPAVTVTSKVTNKTLKKNKDYVVYYYNNLNVGENAAHAQIIGIGNYAGQETEVTFSIKQIEFKGSPSKKVFGSNTEKKYGVFYNGKALVAGRDFTATCDYKTDKTGKYTIYINAVKDDPTCNFSMAKKDKKITAVKADIDWAHLGLTDPTK